MTARFCPDCGAECGARDDICGDCSFPLSIELQSSPDRLTIPKSQLKNWGRISQLLRRGGINIIARPAQVSTYQQLWWALPVSGALIFLISIVFGAKLVDLIWKPSPLTNAQVVRLGKDQAGAAAGERANGSSDFNEIDTSFLREALKTSAEQESLTQGSNADPNDQRNALPASIEDIETWAEQVLLDISVKDIRRKATLIRADGYMLVDTSTLSGAYQRETQTVQREGQLYQETIFIEPEIHLPAGLTLAAESVREGENTGVTLLRGPFNLSIDCEINYDLDFEKGDRVWVAGRESGSVSVFETTIIGVTTNPRGVDLWRVDGNYSPDWSGAPVFNAQGELAGILLSSDGQPSILSLKRFRERSPLVFKEVIN